MFGELTNMKLNTFVNTQWVKEQIKGKLENTSR